MRDFTLLGPFMLMARMGKAPLPPFVFPLGPQHFEVVLPGRGQIHQTVESNWLDDFSGPRSVLAQVTLRGTFGYQPGMFGTSFGPFGSITLRVLEVYFETFHSFDRALKTQTNMVMDFVATSRLYYWRVYLDHLSYRIQSRDPLLYYYELRMRRIEDYLNPDNAVKGAVKGVASAKEAVTGAFGKAKSAVSGAASSLVGGGA